MIEKFSKEINSLKYLPRWLIFIFDIGIVLISLLFSVYFLNKLAKNLFLVENVFLTISFILFVFSISFVFFKTFSGIIRHSAFIDLLKLLLSITFSMCILIIFNFIIEQVMGIQVLLYHGIFVFSVFSFCGMLFLRLFVKAIYDKYILSKNDKKERVFIFGSTDKAVSLARALTLENPVKFYVIAFLDPFLNTNTSKTLLNIPIYSLKNNIATLSRIYNVNSVIFSETKLDNITLNKYINDCLDNQIKVYSAPILDNFSTDNISKRIKSFKIQDLLNRKPIQLDFEKLESTIKGKVILISGATGSIGSEIVRQLIQFQPKKLILVDIAESPMYDLQNEILLSCLNTEVVPVICDVSKLDFIEKHFEQHRPNIIYHAAAYKHVPLMEDNPSQAFITNVIGSKNMADLSVKYNAHKFVMVSTDKAVNPSNVMGATKRLAELYVKALSQKTIIENKNATKFITTRFGNVLGSNGSVVPLFKKQIAKGGPITITHPEITRYFMTIPEACQLVIEAGDMGKGGEIYVFDMGEPVKIVDLAKRMIQLADLQFDKDIKIEFVGLRPGEKLYEELITDKATSLPTHHPKIMIMKEEMIDYEMIDLKILNLKDSLSSPNHQEVVKLLKTLIPEFKSMNSIYEKFDQNN